MRTLVAIFAFLAISISSFGQEMELPDLTTDPGCDGIPQVANIEFQYADANCQTVNWQLELCGDGTYCTKSGNVELVIEYKQFEFTFIPISVSTLLGNECMTFEGSFTFDSYEPFFWFQFVQIDGQKIYSGDPFLVDCQQ